MEENLFIQESLNYMAKQTQENHQHTIMEETLLLVESTRKPKNLISKISHFMINVRLSKNFDPKQFKIISSISPQEWIRSQKELLKQISSNKKLNEKYFSLFLQNHTHIVEWYQLAIRVKGDIEPYVFKEMFTQRKQEAVIQDNFNNEKLKESLLYRSKYNKKEDHKNLSSLIVKGSQDKNSRLNSFLSQKQSIDNNFESENASFMKPTFMPLGFRKSQPKTKQPNKQPPKQAPVKQSSPSSLTQQKQQLMGVFFNNMIEMNQLQNKRKPLNLKLYKLKNKELIDSHDLYMKTFDACNGRKYIFYDYEKHMKGQKEKNKYNFFLRNGMMEASLQNYLNQHQNRSPSQQHKTLSHFQEFNEFKLSQQSRQKCSLLPINLVLNQNQLNNYQGLKKIVNENNSNKVVFVNHQGKPITYYIKQEEKMCQGLSKNTKRTAGNREQRNSVGENSKKEKIEVGNSRTLR